MNDTPADAAPTPGSRRSPHRAAGRRLEGPLDLLHAERLDAVSDLDVIEVLDPDAAFLAFPDLAGVVLEPLEAGERTGVHHRPVPRDPRLGGSLNGAASHHAAGDGADLADLEEL